MLLTLTIDTYTGLLYNTTHKVNVIKLTEYGKIRSMYQIKLYILLIVFIEKAERKDRSEICLK